MEKEGVDGKYGHSDPIKLDYEIVKADPALGGLTVSNCIFGEKPNPSVSANKFGVVVIYRYYYDEECEQEINLTTTPLNTLPVGTYWVKATFAGNPNISAGETQPLSFQITQTGASIGGVINGSTVSKGYRAEGYSFNDLFPNLKASHTETSLVYKVDGEVVDATTFKFVNVKANDGVYTVVITLPESHNYEEVFVTVKVKITPVANTDTFKPSYNVTYGDPISKLEEQLPDSEFGTWTIQETTVGNAGTGKTFTAEFTPYPEYVGNYATRTQPITVNVAKASVTIIDKDETTLPAESTDGRDYNGEAFGLRPPEYLRQPHWLISASSSLVVKFFGAGFCVSFRISVSFFGISVSSMAATDIQLHYSWKEVKCQGYIAPTE